MLKLGVVGKGGVGKTTTSALLAQAYSARGQRVIAIDTDSNPNLAFNLGLEPDAADTLPVLPRSLVVGRGDGAITPAELMTKYGTATPSEVTLLHAMRISQAGAG